MVRVSSRALLLRIARKGVGEGHGGGMIRGERPRGGGRKREKWRERAKGREREGRKASQDRGRGREGERERGREGKRGGKGE